MITSMTAYARSAERSEDFEADVEIRTYNSRHLDFSLRVPHGYNPVEGKIREVVASRLARGRIEIKLTVKDESEAAQAFEVNIQKANAYINALDTLSEMAGINESPSLEMLSGASGILTPAAVNIDFQREWPIIEKSLLFALKEIKKMRQNEGDYLKKDFEKRLLFIEEALGKIELESFATPEAVKLRLTERIKHLTEGVVQIEEERIAQEAAIIADKSDISEEIVRVKSHISQFYEIMESVEPGGRKLNFLLQEFNREFNTMGSKAGNADIAHIIVNVKAELEKMREQIQNVE